MPILGPLQLTFATGRLLRLGCCLGGPQLLFGSILRLSMRVGSQDPSGLKLLLWANDPEAMTVVARSGCHRWRFLVYLVV